MTDEEMEKFCAEVMSGVRKIGFACREMKGESGPYFEFIDPATKVVIRGQANSNKKIALTNACQTIVKYLDIKSE